ncbi:MAG: DUF4445 domain-containing protein [Nitrospirae bacterium]|nr:MAG: DUF4445 domain-containing protein [Nitrospirota bacterium]
MSSLVFQKNVLLPSPSEDDRRADDQRIKDSLGIEDLHIPLGILKRLGLHENPFPQEFSCVIGRNGPGHKIIDIKKDRSYSVALDLGTTNIAAVLLDNISRKKLLETSVENPQIDYGCDILTRMHQVMSSTCDEVYSALLKGVNDLLSQICAKTGIGLDDIHAVSVAGNTVMTHFFMGLDIGAIPALPFVPVVRTPGFLGPSDLGLNINPEGIVYIFPNAGSYVGGDIVAGIIASGMTESNEISVLIDVGTNAEIVAGNSEWMIVAAGAAGPALEEGISMIGRRAQNGVIYDIEIKNGDCACKTFDEARPEGICGSGMVSLLYEMYKSGIIDQNGKLNASSPNVINAGEETAYRISCNGHAGLDIRQTEINNFLKSKAAMFTLLLVLLRSVGVSFSEIKNVYVSGALGTGINAAKASGIGMLPEWPASIIKPLGNSSLTGAFMLLTDNGLIGKIDAITAKITYKHMHDDPEFMREFMGAVFVPHTNPALLKV